MTNVLAFQKGPVLGDDAAAAEFDRFIELMGLDFDEASFTDEDRKGFEDLKYKIVKAIRAGTLIVHDAADQPSEPNKPRKGATFSPVTGGEPITFWEPTGQAYIAMDQRKKDHLGEKMHEAIAAVTRQPAVRFTNMPMRDLKVCHAIINLFFASK
jgi:hypothetical protein